MKKIKLKNKLSLNKETVAKLNDDQMNDVKGGLMSITFHCTHSLTGCGPNGDKNKQYSDGRYCN
jgi:hypothetical protein